MKKSLAVLLLIFCAYNVAAQEHRALDVENIRFPMLTRKNSFLTDSLMKEKERLDEEQRKWSWGLGELDDEVNIDSLFVSSIEALKLSLDDNIQSRRIHSYEYPFIMFVSFITNDDAIRNLDLGHPHMPEIDLSDIEIIEKWYLDNKEKLTWEAVKPAYNFNYRQGKMTKGQLMDLIIGDTDYTID